MPSSIMRKYNGYQYKIWSEADWHEVYLSINIGHERLLEEWEDYKSIAVDFGLLRSEEIARNFCLDHLRENYPNCSYCIDDEATVIEENIHELNCEFEPFEEDNEN